MDFEWDERKNAANIKSRGFGFDVAQGFEWEFALGPTLEYVDGEEREIWTGPAGNEIYVLVVTLRENITRVISMRVAKNSEKRRWRKEFQDA